MFGKGNIEPDIKYQSEVMHKCVHTWCWEEATPLPPPSQEIILII